MPDAVAVPEVGELPDLLEAEVLVIEGVVPYGEDHAVGGGMEHREDGLEDAGDMDRAELGDEQEQEESRPHAPEVGELQSRQARLLGACLHLDEVAEVVDEDRQDAQQQVGMEGTLPFPDDDPRLRKKPDNADDLNDQNEMVHSDHRSCCWYWYYYTTERRKRQGQAAIFLPPCIRRKTGSSMRKCHVESPRGIWL